MLDWSGLKCSNLTSTRKLELKEEVQVGLWGASVWADAKFEMKGELCEVCCDDGSEGDEFTASITSSVSAGFSIMWGRKSEFDAFGLSGEYFFGIEGSGSYSASANADFKYSTCDGGESSVEVCAQGAITASLRVGGYANLESYFFDISLGIQGNAHASIPLTICAKCDKNGCKITKKETGQPTASYSVEACWGSCYTTAQGSFEKITMNEQLYSIVIPAFAFAVFGLLYLVLAYRRLLYFFAEKNDFDNFIKAERISIVASGATIVKLFLIFTT